MGNMVEITTLLVKESGGSVVDSIFSILMQMVAQTKLNGKLSMKEKDMNTNGFFLISEFPEKISCTFGNRSILIGIQLHF